MILVVRRWLDCMIFEVFSNLNDSIMLCCCPNLSLANGSSFRLQLDTGLQPAAKTPPDRHQARLLFMGSFCTSWKGHSQNYFTASQSLQCSNKGNFFPEQGKTLLIRAHTSPHLPLSPAALWRNKRKKGNSRYRIFMPGAGLHEAAEWMSKGNKDMAEQRQLRSPGIVICFCALPCRYWEHFKWSPSL